jgi:hypothetical protein
MRMGIRRFTRLTNGFSKKAENHAYGVAIYFMGRTAAITGSLRSDGWLVADVKAPNVTCTGILVPWYTPPAGAGNG